MSAMNNAANATPRAGAACAAVALVGLAGWLACAGLRGPDAAWRALFVNFLFFTPLAAGLVTWPAIVMLSRGEWLGPVKHDALAGLVLAPVSLLALAALWLGRAHAGGALPDAQAANAAWLARPFLFARDGAALLLWWGVAAAFAFKARPGAPKALAGAVALLYGLVFSLLGFDLVMALDPRWCSALFGGYFFITGLYAAVAALTLLSALRRPGDRPRLHDLGKLLLTFSIMSTYLMFSQLLPIWYANLPHEIRFVLPRLKAYPWSLVSAALLAGVYLGPLVLLLTVWSKRTAWYLGLVAGLVLAGLWVERWWLVAPALGGAHAVGGADVALALAFAGALGWGVCRFGHPSPEGPARADADA